MTNRLLVVAFLFFVGGYSVQSQSNIVNGQQPEVGKVMPDFVLNNVHYFKKKKVSNEDFKGDWLVLDFWTQNCVVCIKDMPEVNELQKKFKDKIQFILIGSTSSKLNAGYKPNIEQLYEKVRKRYNLDIASAYDSSLFHRFGITATPARIIVDPQGIVRDIAIGTGLTEDGIKELMAGNKPSFLGHGMHSPEYDLSKFPGSENNRLVYRSILTRANGEVGSRTIIREFVNGTTEKRKYGIKFTMQPLYRLYQSAFFGTWYDPDLINEFRSTNVIIEVKDSGLFKFDYNSSSYSGLYNYNLAVDSSKSNDLAYLQRIFQQELKNTFGFDAFIEKRKMPAWKLIAKPGVAEKLKAKPGARSKSTTPYLDISFVDASMGDIVKYIWSYNQGGLPFYDETGIAHNIDMDFEGSMTEIDDIKKSLIKNGLDLVEGEKELEVIVIKDPK